MNEAKEAKIRERKKNALRMRIFRATHPEIDKKRKHEDYLKHKEKILEKGKNRYRLEGDKIRKQVSDYRIKNKDIISERKKADYSKNRKKVLEKAKKYYLENRDKVSKRGKTYRSKAEVLAKILERNRIRRILMISLQENTDITIDFMIQLRKDNPNCAMCHGLLTNKKGDNQTHLDHIIPLNVGGKHEIRNVRLVCRKCNLSRPKDGRDVLFSIRPISIMKFEKAINY